MSVQVHQEQQQAQNAQTQPQATATPTQPPTQAAQPVVPNPQTPAVQPVVFQLAPPAPQPPVEVAPQPPAQTDPAPTTPSTDYKATVERFASAALGQLSESDQALIKSLAGDDPAKQLDTYTQLQKAGKIGQANAPASNPPAAPVVPNPASPAGTPTSEAQTAPPPPPVDRSRMGGGDTKPPPPKTPEEARRRVDRALRGKTVSW